MTTPTTGTSKTIGQPLARKASPKISGLMGKLIANAAVLVLWQIIAISPIADGGLPTPVEVLQAFIGLVGTSTYWVAIGATLRSWAAGLALCAVIGVPVGLLIGTSLRASKSTQWVIDFYRTIPAIALLPLVLLLFGPTFRMEITMIVLAAIWPLLIQSMYAARQVEPLLKWVVRVFRISTVDRLRYLWAPSVSLFVFTGLRLAATMALLMTISAEYIGGAAGLGLELSYMDQGMNRRHHRPAHQHDHHPGPTPPVVVAPHHPRRAFRMKRLKSFAWEIWLPIVLIGAWLILSAGSRSFYFPALSSILQRVQEVWFFNGIVENMLPSLIRILAGFGLGLLVGVVAGTMLGLLPRIEGAIRPLLEFLRSTPGVALLPIAVIFLGIGDGMKIFMIALASMWPILLNTIDGVRSVEPVLLQVARSYRLTLADRVRFIYIPNAAPQIFAGARVSLAIAAVVMVVTEMIGSPGGIGYFILDSQRTFKMLDMWSGIVMLGVLGFLLNLGFRLVEAHVLAWHHKKNA